MSDHDRPVSEHELHAYVDGELPPSRIHAVEAWLAEHPADSAAVASWRRQAEMIRGRFPDRDERVPERFALQRLAYPRWRAPLRVAAMLALFVAGGAFGWAGHAWTVERGKGPTVTAEALEAHQLYMVEVRHPVEVPGSEAAHLEQWLSKRVGHTIKAPSLEQFGLTLLGGRLLPGPVGVAAAFFMYEGPSGERFTLYCARAGGSETALRYSDAGQLGAFYWLDGGFAYVVSGPADRDRLRMVAQATYEQLEPRGPERKSSGS